MFQCIVLTIRGVPVYLRSLPSGDMTVWHPYNEYIRAMVEPICRNRGHWKVEYNNWIIFRKFKDAVLADLENVAHS